MIRGRLTNEDVHVVCSAADNHANTDETRADDGDITTADQIRQGPNEGTDCCKTEQVGEDLSTNP